MHTRSIAQIMAANLRQHLMLVSKVADLGERRRQEGRLQQLRDTLGRRRAQVAVGSWV
jgi:hypothetical protein